jgi:hypothetical protein
VFVGANFVGYFFFDFDGFGIDLGKFAGIGLFPVFGTIGLMSFFAEVPFFVSLLDDFSFVPRFVLESPLLDFSMPLVDFFIPLFVF